MAKYIKLGAYWGMKTEGTPSQIPFWRRYNIVTIPREWNVGVKTRVAIADGFRIVAIGIVTRSLGAIGTQSQDFVDNFKIATRNDAWAFDNNECYKVDWIQLEEGKQFKIECRTGITGIGDKFVPQIEALINDWTVEREGTCNMNHLADLLLANSNLILTGAPGTGKTYLARQLAQKLIFGDAWETKDEKAFSDAEKTEFERRFRFVQFHPSYDYTDFVEGLRPKAKSGESGNIGFELKDGSFKEFCEAAHEECKYKDNGEYDEASKKFVFVIDEINRGEISKIFGELFFSIDPGYRGVAGKVLTQYANMRAGSDDKKKFYVSENVYIIGTMNDIDRSVESFDFAMRRRFVWEEIKAWETTEDKTNIVPMLDELDQIKEGLAKDAITHLVSLNQAIWNDEGDGGKGMGIDGLSSSFHIGGAYFLKLKNYNGDFRDLWKYHLEPLLREYLRGMPEEKDNLGKLKAAYESANNG